MKMLMKKHHKKIMLVMGLLGMMGTVLFFPAKMESGNTCLFETIFIDDIKHIPDKLSHSENTYKMLNQYLMPLAFIWWLSLFVISLSIYRLKKGSHSKKEHICN